MNRVQNHSVACFAILFVAATAGPAQARRVDIPESAKLLSQAPIVCNGTVVELVNTLEKSTVAFPYYRQLSCPVEFWKAKIKILHTAKGKVPNEIEVRFPQIDEHPAGDKSVVIADGPIQISLIKGQRYRLFLKPAQGHPWYVGVVDGEFDDGYAVQPLATIEPDDSPPPMSRSEAIQFATDYVKKLEPSADISTVPPEASNTGDGTWTIKFWSPPVRAHEGPATARVEVVGNRQIDRGTWVADFCTPVVSDLKTSDVDRKFWVYMQPYPKDKKFYATDTFPPMIFLGTITAITNQEIELSNVSQWNSTSTWPTLKVPTEDVHWFQRLNPGAVPTSVHAPR